jgi:hypothetical protein
VAPSAGDPASRAEPIDVFPAVRRNRPQHGGVDRMAVGLQFLQLPGHPLHVVEDDLALFVPEVLRDDTPAEPALRRLG